VVARVSDPDGVASATVRWRVDPINVFTDVPMHDDGLDGDLLPGDGVFAGTVPAQTAGKIVIFRVEATDAAAAPTGAVFPPDAPAHECLVRVGDPPQGGDFAAYRMWLTPTNVARWASREKFGNEPVDVTFVYGGVRAVYGCGGWYAGSEASTPGFSSPVTGTLCGYHIAPPGDDLVLGEDNFKLDFPVRDTTDQREVLMFWMAEQLRLPNLYRRYVHLFTNGTRRGPIYDDVQTPDQTVADEFFPDDTNGHLFKSNNWTEGADNGNTTSSGEANVLRHYNSGGQHKLARYRWNWRPRAARSANEFGDLFALIDRLNVSTTAPGYQAGVEALVDVENWMRTFAFHDLCSYWDGFGNPNHKNTYLYKPVAAGWVQFTWDMDVGLGVFNDPVNAALFSGSDPRVDALQAFAPFRRIYWRTIDEAFSTFFSGAGVTPHLDRRYNAFKSNGLSLTSPFVASGAYGLSITQWIDQRRAYIQTQLNAVTANFAVTSAPSVTVTEPAVTITGTAPVRMRTLTLEGVALPVTWTSVTAWRLTFVPVSGTRSYHVRALDRDGQEVGSGAVEVTFTGTNAWPAVRLSEWGASNTGSVLDPADGKADDWLELFNPSAEAVSLAGWRLSDSTPTPTTFIFPAGFNLPAGGYLLGWCDEEPVQSSAPNSLHLPSKLSANGETLTLTAPDGTVVDTVTFGPQVSDISQGRLDGSTTAMAFLTSPSAGAANASAIAEPGLIATITAPGELSFTVSTTPGFSYQLQAKDTLMEQAWTDLGSAVTASGSSVVFSDTISGRSQRFYRVVRSL
jgi:CotH kinase protein/Lamin Tail Domain